MKKSDESGISSVELALLMPLVLLILFGIVEFGLILYDKQEITNASREGARKGAVYELTKDPSGNNVRMTKDEAYIKNYVINDCLKDLGTNKSRLITFASGAANVTAIPTAGCTSFGANLTVTVTYPYHFLLVPNIEKLLGSNGSTGINLSTSTTMRCE